MTAPLTKRFPTKSVLSLSIIVLEPIMTLFLRIDAGHWRKAEEHDRQ